ncbi:hypothetical protein C922_03229 [Plasmodium inui San Antonio 1]|uniref:GYF domain-containing protein n=1 Tax=Plasmodium inui San Antonio 1 TaxID=1237626 RepID=W7A4T3_9APIC|nr:hypothetical protein C922_03229 [Plasmodium inui San Antonio 1]EUD66313.1 hypothetical protein C922_03229 [Plasmodium inui San Antonio 1]
MEETNVAEEVVQGVAQEEHANEKKGQNDESPPSGESAPNGVNAPNGEDATNGENAANLEKTLTEEDFKYDENRIVYTKNEFLYAYIELILNEKGLGEDHDLPLCSNQFKFPELFNDLRKGDDEKNHLGGEEGDNDHSKSNAIGDEEDGGVYNKHHYRNFAERGGSSSAFFNNEIDRGRIRNDFFTRDGNNFMNKNNLQDSTDSNNPLNSMNRRSNHLLKNNKFSKFFNGGNASGMNISGGNHSGNQLYGGSKNQFEAGLGEGSNRNSFIRKTNFHADGNNPAFMGQDNAGNNNPMGGSGGHLGSNTAANKTLWREYDKGISSWRSSKTDNKTDENVKNDPKLRGPSRGFSKSFPDNMKMTSPSPQNSDDENENNNDVARNMNKSNYPNDRGPMHIKREDMFTNHPFGYKNLNMTNNMGQMSSSGAFINQFNSPSGGYAAGGATSSTGATSAAGASSATAYSYHLGVNSMGRHAQNKNDGVRSSATGAGDPTNKRSVENNTPGSLNHSSGQNKNFNFPSPTSAFYGNKAIGSSSGPKKGFSDLHTMMGTNATGSAAAFLAPSGSMASSNNVNTDDDWKMKKYKKIPASGNNPEQHQQLQPQQQPRMGEEKAKRGDDRNEFANLFMNKGNESSKLNMHGMGSVHEVNLYNYAGNSAGGASSLAGGVHPNVTYKVKGSEVGKSTNPDMLNNDLTDGRGNHSMDEMNRTGANDTSAAMINSMGRKIGRGGAGTAANNNFSASHEMVRGPPSHASGNVSGGNNQNSIGSTPFNINRGAKGNQKRETKNEKHVLEDDWSNIRRKSSFVDSKKATDDFMWHKMSEQFDKNNKISFDSLYLKTDQSVAVTLSRRRNYDHSSVGGANTGAKNERKDSAEGSNHTLGGNIGGNLSGHAFPALKAKKANDGSFPAVTPNSAALKSNEQQKGAAKLNTSAEDKPGDGSGNNKPTTEKSKKKKKKGDKDGAKGGERGGEKDGGKDKENVSKNGKQNGEQQGKQNDKDTHLAQGTEDQNRQMKAPGENVKMNPKDTSNDNIYNSFHEENNSALHESSYYKFSLNEKKYVHKNNNLNCNPNHNPNPNVNVNINTNKNKNLNEKKELIFNKLYHVDKINLQEEHRGMMMAAQKFDEHDLCRESSQQPYRVMGGPSSTHPRQQQQRTYEGLLPTHGTIIGKTDQRNLFETNNNSKPAYPFQEKESSSSSSLNERYFLANRYAKYDQFKNNKISEDRDSMMGSIPQESLLQKIKRKQISAGHSMNNASNPNDVRCANNVHSEDGADNTSNLNNSGANGSICPQQRNHKEHAGSHPGSHMNQKFNPTHLVNKRHDNLVDLASSPNCMDQSVNSSNISYLLSVMRNAEAVSAGAGTPAAAGGVNVMTPTPITTNRSGNALFTSAVKGARSSHPNLSQPHTTNQKYYSTPDINRCSEEGPMDREQLTRMEKQNILLKRIMSKIKMEENIYNKLSQSEKEELLNELALTNAKRVDAYGYAQEDTSPLLSMIGKDMYHSATGSSGVLEGTHQNLKNTTSSMELMNYMYGNSARMNVRNNKFNVATTNVAASYRHNGEDNGDDGNKDHCNLKNKINHMSKNEALSYTQEVEFAGRHLLCEGGKGRGALDEEEKKGHSDKIAAGHSVEITCDHSGETAGDQSASHAKASPPAQSDEKSSFMNVSRWLKYFSRGKGSDQVEGPHVSAKEKAMQMNEVHHIHDSNEGGCTDKGTPSGGVKGLEEVEEEEAEEEQEADEEEVEEEGQATTAYRYNTQGVMTPGGRAQQKCQNNSNADYTGYSSNHFHEQAEVEKKIFSGMKEEKKGQQYDRVDSSSPPCAVNENVSSGMATGRNLLGEFPRKGINSTGEDAHKNSENRSNVDITNNQYIHIISRINKIRGDVWQYKDPAGNVQGPFSSELMFYWWSLKYFPQNLPLRFNENMPWVSFNEMFPPGTFPFVFPLTSFPKNNYHMVKKDNDHSSAQQGGDLANSLEAFKTRSSLESQPLRNNRLNSAGLQRGDTNNYLYANGTASQMSSLNRLNHLNHMNHPNRLNHMNHLVNNQDNLSSKGYNIDVAKNQRGILTQEDGITATLTTATTSSMYNDKEYSHFRDGGKQKSDGPIPTRGERDIPRRAIHSTGSGSSPRTDKEVTEMEKYLLSGGDHRDDNVKTATQTYKAKGNMQSQNNYAGAHHSAGGVIPPISTAAAIGAQKFPANYKDGGNAVHNSAHHTRDHVSGFPANFPHHDTKLPNEEKGTNLPHEEADQDDDPFSGTIRWMPEKLTKFPKMFEFELSAEGEGGELQKGVQKEIQNEAGEKLPPGAAPSQLYNDSVALRDKNQQRAGDEEEEMSTKLRDNSGGLNDRQMNQYTVCPAPNAKTTAKSDNKQPSDKLNTHSKSNNVVVSDDTMLSLTEANSKRSVANHEGGPKAKAKMVPSTVGSGKQAKDGKVTARKPEEEEDTSEGYATMKKNKKGKNGKREKGEKPEKANKAEKTDKIDKADQVKKTEKKRNKTNGSGKEKEKNHHQMDETTQVDGQMGPETSAIAGHWEEAKKKRKGDDIDKAKADEGEKDVAKKSNNPKKKKKESGGQLVGKNGEAPLPQQSECEEQQHREKKAQKEGKKEDSSKVGTAMTPSTSNAVNPVSTASSSNPKGTEKKTEKMKWSITGERKIDKLVDIMKGEEKSVNMKIKIENSKKKMAASANGNNASCANGTVKKSGWDVSFSTSVKDSDNVNFPHLSTGGGSKQSKAKAGAKGNLTSKVSSLNKNTANSTLNGSGVSLVPFTMAFDNNNAKGVGAKGITDVSIKKQSEKKKWKSESGDLQPSEEDKKFPPLLNSAAGKVESTKKKTNNPPERELTDLKQLTSMCKLPLDDSLLNFLKNFKKADEIYAFLQHSVEDKKKLSQFAKEFIKINSKNDVNGQTAKKKK